MFEFVCDTGKRRIWFNLTEDLRNVYFTAIDNAHFTNIRTIHAIQKWLAVLMSRCFALAMEDLDLFNPANQLMLSLFGIVASYDEKLSNFFLTPLY